MRAAIKESFGAATIAGTNGGYVRYSCL